MIGLYRQQLIEQLIAEDGERCRYCKVRVRKNWMETERHEHDATVDHIVPKAKGGSNKRENLALACRRCNNAKGDRSVEAFLRDPNYPYPKRWARRRRGVQYVPIPDETRKWPLPRGATLNAVPVVNRIPKPKMTALETARWLRESARKNGQSWPLA